MKVKRKVTEKQLKALKENGNRFTSENRPDKEKHRQGVIKSWERRKFYEQLFKEFCKPLVLENGEEVDTIKAGLSLIKSSIFGNPKKDKDGKFITKPLTALEKSKLFLDWCEFIGIKESKLNLSSDDESIKSITFEFVDSPERKKEKSNKPE